LLYLDHQQLASLGISTKDIVTAIEDTLIQKKQGSVTTAPKTGASTDDGRYLMATLAASDKSRIVAVKSVLSNPRNKAADMPSTNGSIMLLDSEHGQLKAVLDANWITAVRTAGLSVVAAKHLANKESLSIGLIGAGVQAESHLRAFADFFPLAEVRVFSRGKAGIEHIQKIAQDLNLSFEQCNPETCLRESDIVVSAVSRDFSIQPFLDARLMRAGSFAAITDLAIPWCSSGLIGFDEIYIDDLAQERLMEHNLCLEA